MATKRTPKPRSIEIVPGEEPVDSLARRTFIVLSVAVGFGVLLGFLYEVRAVLLLIFIALVFALALEPAVGWLVKHRWKRGVAAFVAVITTLVVVLGLLAAVTAPLISETTKLVDNAPQIVDDISHNQNIRKFEEKYHIREKVDELARKAPDYISGSQSTVLGTVQKTFGAVANVAIIITLTFFLLLEGPGAWKMLVSAQRAHHKRRLANLGSNISTAVGGYVSGNLFISLIAATLAYLTMVILHVPYAFPLAVLVAIFDLIPMVGASLATIILGLVALSQGVTTAVILVAVMIVYQNVEGHILQPVIYARTVSLSPLLVLIATVTGADLGGIVGVLLAIPIASIAQILFIDILKGTAAGRRAHLEDAAN